MGRGHGDSVPYAFTGFLFQRQLSILPKTTKRDSTASSSFFGKKEMAWEASHLNWLLPNMLGITFYQNRTPNNSITNKPDKQQTLLLFTQTIETINDNGDRSLLNFPKSYLPTPYSSLLLCQWEALCHALYVTLFLNPRFWT